MNPNLFVPSATLCEMFYKDADPYIQLSPLRQPSFEDEGRMERIKEHITADVIGWISILGHTYKFKKVPSITIIEGNHVSPRLVNLVRERFMLNDPAKGQDVLDKFASEFKDHLKRHQLSGDWGKLVLEGENVVLLVPTYDENKVAKEFIDGEVEFYD